MAREFITTGDLEVQENVNLEDCDSDPIHQTALIQPHGTFLQCDPDTFEVRAAARNLDKFLSIPAPEALGRPIDDVLGQSVGTEMDDFQSGFDLDKRNISFEVSDRTFIGQLFVTGRHVGIEFESATAGGSTSKTLLLNEHTITKKIQQANNKNALLQEVTRVVREQSGYGRVMVLQFEQQGHGHVIAETRNEEFGSYLDQYFPASDVPEPARRLYRKNDLRYIPTVDYEPVPVVDRDGELDREDLDLTYSDYRNVPLIHRKYLRNMNVNASMSIPLMVDGNLWGLIVSHSTQSGVIDWFTREFLKRIGQMTSTALQQLEAVRREQKHRAVDDIRDQHLQRREKEPELFEFLRRSKDDVFDLLNTNAFYLRLDNESLWLSHDDQQRPPAELFEWVEDQLESNQSLRIDSLLEDYDGDWNQSDVYSGLMAMRITHSSSSFCVWFRPEVQSRIEWGGDPRNPLLVDDEGELNPRSSFEKWTQIKKGQCKKWEDIDAEVGRDLINIINEVALAEKSRELTNAKVELERQNDQLQSTKEILVQKTQELEEANERLEELSLYDDLTGTANRRQFEQVLKSNWKLLERKNQKLSLIMIDIDHFKEYNDRYGHQQGDQCLKKVARSLQEGARRDSDTVARYGGEEFAVILPDTDAENAEEIAETMRKNVEELRIPHEASPVSEYVTVSLGIETFEDLADKDPDDLINNADEALYKAKENGRNRLVVHGH